MKYFRFTKPKYDLIAAYSKERAIQLYKEKLYKENKSYRHKNINYKVEQFPLHHHDTNQRKIRKY